MIYVLLFFFGVLGVVGVSLGSVSILVFRLHCSGVMDLIYGEMGLDHVHHNGNNQAWNDIVK